MIHSYCIYGIYNEDTAQVLEPGDSVDRLSYRDNGKKITLEDVQINDINKDEIMIETEDYEEITIPIEEIEDWDREV